MNRNRLYLVGLCLLVVGAVFAFQGYADGGFHQVFIDRNLQITLPAERRTELHADEPLVFTSVQIEADVMDIELVPADAFALDAWYSEVKPIEYAVEGGVLRISAKPRDGRINIGVSLGDMDRLRLAVPKSVSLDAVSIESDVGLVSIGAIEAKDVRVVSNVGEVRIDGATAQSVDVRADTGNVRIIGVDFEKCAVHTDVGSMDLGLKGEPGEYALHLSTDVGTISVPEGVRYGGVQRGARTLDASTDVGGIFVRFVQ
jgi:hypothetical protein